MKQKTGILFIFILIAAALILSACAATTSTPPALNNEIAMATPALFGIVCEACERATLAAAQTQQISNIDNQSAATAEIMRANAQATLNSSNATLIAAQTQQQNSANVVAAQIAATVEIERANAQATLNSAGSTQSAALMQDSIRQTQSADIATTTAAAVLNKQNQDLLAAGTQTAIANNIATQTQVAAATSQWYTDQKRQSDAQRQAPVTFLLIWCLPIFVLILAGLAVLGIGRWLKIQREEQRLREKSLNQPPASAIENRPHQHDGALPYLESNIVNDGYQVTKPDDQVSEWIDEVKNQLLNSDKKDEDDNTNK